MVRGLLHICGKFCVDALHPSQQFFNHVGTIPVPTSCTKQWIKCLTQGHNTLTPVSLELLTGFMQASLSKI